MTKLERIALGRLANWLRDVPADILQVPPIDLEAVGACWGVEKIIERELDVAGLLYRLDGGGSVVFVKSGDSPGRKRFSWAHELGHILMSSPGSAQVACRKPGQIDRALERSCDIIATEILMPQQEFSAKAGDFGWTLRAIRTLADTFQVTVQAAVRRLMELIDELALMSVWCPRPHQPLLRLKHSWSIPNQPGKQWRPQVLWQTGPDFIPPMYQALNEARVVSGVSKVLMYRDGETRYQWVQTEALGVGRGDKRTVLGFHYLSRIVGPTGVRNNR